MVPKRLWRAGVAGALLAVLIVPAALGYQGQVAGQVSVTGGVACSTSLDISAKVLDINGKPFDNADVTWAFKEGTSKAGDSLEPTSTKTDGAGVARTHVSLVDRGRRTVIASSGTSAGSIVLNATCSGLPNTSTAPETPAPVPFLALVALLVVAASAALVGTRAIARR